MLSPHGADPQPACTRPSLFFIGIPISGPLSLFFPPLFPRFVSAQSYASLEHAFSYVLRPSVRRNIFQPYGGMGGGGADHHDR